MPEANMRDVLIAATKPSRQFMIQQAVLNAAAKESLAAAMCSYLMIPYLRGRFSIALELGDFGGIESIVSSIRHEYHIIANRYEAANV